MTSQEKSERIEQYIAGKLSGPALQAFEKEMQEDSDFAKEVALQKEVFEALSEGDLVAFRAQLESIRDRRRNVPGRNGINFSFLRIGSLAAAVIVLIAAGFWLFQNHETTSPSELFTAYFEAPAQLYHSPGNERNGETTARDKRHSNLDLWAKVEASYELQNYQEALSLLQAAPLEIANDFKSEINYQMGVLLLLNHQPEEAIAHFSKVETAHQDQRDWYVALAFLKLGDRPAETKAAFEKIAGSKSPWREKAKEILGKLPL